MTTKERREFLAYLHACTDAQVQGVFDKETAAGRRPYALLAKSELYRRNLL